jgi:hypothetical protein
MVADCQYRLPVAAKIEENANGVGLDIRFGDFAGTHVDLHPDGYVETSFELHTLSIVANGLQV